ncbi:hypothetical protein GH714_027069 [Hevea brasiliensis]|uniref:Uncharacterized protein n=1 Tax=Hevea brasiliensis TaxID=3981 RepID=A0A6A6N7Y1_HEVBR|nr:hypothetical protein GH714_027069 [Hevea brasiliensis]
MEDEFIDSSSRLICCEEIDGRRWKYVAENDGFGCYKKNSIRAVSLHTPQAPVEEMISFIRTYVVPEGFPHSVTPSYVPYMTWRALKDGAGRVGKMLFARQGKKFDCDLKQNVAAVTSTSTRTPIYKAFAKGENTGDVTAKGECVGNLADLVKSVVLHTLNRARFSVAVDSFLKTGRVPSLQEGNTMENIFSFPWLKERPIVLGPKFKDAFQDPSAYLAIEPLFEKERYLVTYNPSKDKVYALLKDQAKSDDILKAAFHVRYNCLFTTTVPQAEHSVRYVLSCFTGSLAFAFHKLSNNSHSSSWKQQAYGHSNNILSATDLEAHIADSCKMVSNLYGPFKSKAAEQGWRMSDSLLNPGRARIVVAC